MSQQTRFSAAILRGHHILLIQHHFLATGERYWGLPGGRQEPGETDAETVAREVLEETGLIVRVERLLLDEPSPGGGRYSCYKTYLCTPLGGTARPGLEPEADTARVYEISGIIDIDLFDETSWGQDIRDNPVTGPLLRRIRENL